MGKKKRRRWKVVLLLLGILLLGIILLQDITEKKESIPKEKGIKIQNVQIQMNALFQDFAENDNAAKLEEEKKKDEYLNTKGFESVLTYLEENQSFLTDRTIIKNYEITYAEWNTFFETLLKTFDKEGKIKKVETTILGTKETVKGNDQTVLEEGQVITEKGLFFVFDGEVLKHLYRSIFVYEKDGEILTYEGEGENDFVFNNIFVAEAGNKQMLIVSGKWLLTIPYNGVKDDTREQVADIYFTNGKVSKVETKKEKMTGKVLAFTENSIEIAGKGVFSLAENMRVFMLHDRLEEKTRADLRVGLEYTDYVLDGKKIVACLITQKEDLEKIRVLIKTNDFAGNYHTEIILCPDTEVDIRSGQNVLTKKAGEEIKIALDSDLFNENRIQITPAALTAKTAAYSIKRTQGVPVYRGSFEIEKTKDGLLLINELPLEEYLYAVVPSEMPASYPKEALKAQAICARTYAYRNLNNVNMAALGANVDDSVGYQVYNNIMENSETTSAVKETQGKIIRYNGELAGTYYYSTSCGYGSNIEVWAGNSVGDYPYLKGKKIGETVSDNQLASADEIQEEDKFLEFIQTTVPTDFEANEGWYRWKYEVTKLEVASLEARIKERYPLEEFKSLGKIKNLSIQKRNQGGIAEELLIEGTKNSFLVQKEYNIRYILSDRESEIRKQNGETLQAGNLLPSAYIYLTPKKEGKYVTGYNIEGGGYGHGVGMSQNGAKGMAEKGYDSNQIISFFYEGALIETIYGEGK